MPAAVAALTIALEPKLSEGLRLAVPIVQELQVREPFVTNHLKRHHKMKEDGQDHLCAGVLGSYDTPRPSITAAGKLRPSTLPNTCM